MNVTKDQISTLVGNLQLENMALRNELDAVKAALDAAVRELAARDAAPKLAE